MVVADIEVSDDIIDWVMVRSEHISREMMKECVESAVDYANLRGFRVIRSSPFAMHILSGGTEQLDANAISDSVYFHTGIWTEWYM
jgi:hypothetical protein